jgi:poly-gamma-glutamate synthesis protein (capsule biosynthesis protein)
MQYKFIVLSIITILNFNIVLGQSQNDTIVSSETEISLLFIGDFMGHQDQIDAAYNSKTKEYQYDSCFHYIKPLLSDADFSIGNLEVTLGIKPFSGYPQFSSPPSFAEAINNAGVDILATVNNHSCDKSKKGLERTIHLLDSLNIQHLGTYYSQNDKDSLSPLIIEKNNIKIALLSYTYGTNGLKPVSPNIVNYLDSSTIAADIKNAKALNPDIIIAYVHWGIQYKDKQSKRQEQWKNYFNTLGVKIIIGSHPHVVQPMKWNKSDTSLVVYSLGNFVSHQRTFPRDGGVVFKLTLVKNNNKIGIKDAKYALSWVYEPIVKGKKQYYILPVEEFENKPEFFLQKKHYDKMMRYTKHARNHFKSSNLNIGEM